MLCERHEQELMLFCFPHCLGKWESAQGFLMGGNGGKGEFGGSCLYRQLCFYHYSCKHNMIENLKPNPSVSKLCFFIVYGRLRKLDFYKFK